ncbi:MAG TPA: YfhO family protein [Candidatus Saccharimonadales bacterium]|nr:YfhO family protein [Candidatus Saccharimonadales bacterium]
MDPTLEDQPNTAAKFPPENESWLWMDQFTVGRLAGLITLFLFALYPGVILGTHSFFYRDFGVFTYPVAYYAHESFWHGQVPLWNPLNNCGVPFLAQWNASVCYPPSLIYMLFPLPWSLNIFCLSHLVLAGAGMYWLAYRWTQNRLAASVAGLIFALNGLMLNSLMWTSNLAALSWQPLVVLWVEQAWRGGGARRVVIAALAGAMQMLSGAPEIVVFTWVMLGLLWLGHVWQRKILLWLTLRRFITIVTLIAGLAAIQLLPFFDLLKHSERNSTYSATVAGAWPMPIWGWANFVVPVFHCLQTGFGTWMQADQPWTASYYLGTGTLALAALAVWQLRRQLEICGLAGITLAGLVLALGNNGYIYTWLKHIMPWIGFARYPIKFISIPIFTISLLAAFGLSTFQSTTFKIRRRNECLLFFAAAFLLLAVIVILAMARWLPTLGYNWLPIWRDGAFRSLFLIAIVGCVSALIRAPTPRLRGLLGLALLALVGFDFVTSGLHANPVVVTKAFGPLELNMTSRPQLGESRAMIGRQVLSYLEQNSAETEDPLYYYVGLRGALFENCNIPENIPKVDGFCSLHLKDEWDIDGILYGVYLDQTKTNPPPAPPLLDFLGVSQISATSTIFAWQERKSFLPLATAGQRPIFADDSETLKKINSASFDPRRVVYLALSARHEIIVTNASEAKIIFRQFGAQQAHLTVEAPAPALVVIAQAYYHDWHAYVDGKPVPLLRANHAFQALQVPAGQHEVTLRYEDWMFRLGAVISTLTLLGCWTSLLAKPKR